MSTANPEVRHDIYDRLARHNRLIGVLRIGVPALAVLLLVSPIVQISISMITDAIPIAEIRLDNDTLVIDSPRFEGRTGNGTVYTMTADRTESRIGDLDVVDLYDLGIDLSGDGGYTARIDFSTAQWTMSQERLVSNEDVFVRDSTGADGVLAGADVDWPNQIITSDGPIRFVFGGGNTLDAATMEHDMGGAIWHFETVQLEMIPAPDKGEERDPFAEDVEP